MFNQLTEILFYNNPLSQWLISAGIIIAAVLFSKCIHWFFKDVIGKLMLKTKNTIDDVLFERMEKPVAFAIILLGFRLAMQKLTFSETVDEYIREAFQILLIINTTWLISRVLNGVIREFARTSVAKKGGSESFNNSVILTMNKLISIFIWIFGIVIALGEVGVNITTLLTGLGIGGVAFALASQDTIKNIFAGVVLFIDRPFRIGDRILVDKYDGVVEEIGIRSVRIRTLDNRLVTMACSKVVDSIIENISSEPARRIVIILRLTYDTSPEKMQFAINLLKKLPNLVPEIKQEVSATFLQFSDFSLNIEYIYHIKKNAHILDTQSKVNITILTLFDENGIKFAFPTNTVILQK